MADDAAPLTPSSDEWLTALRARTPARILASRTGTAYRTSTWLELRQDHAAALDAVHAELDPERDLGADFIARWKLFTVSSQARSKAEFLLRPDLGRRLHESARATVLERCSHAADLQLVVGDGLSAAAVITQVPVLLPLLIEGALPRNWSLGQVFLIRHCRVGVLNDIGDLLDPRVVVLLLGERPGLQAADSLSAYLAYRPRHGHTDAQRNLISNIHGRGVNVEEAARRIVALAAALRERETSGVAVKEG